MPGVEPTYSQYLVTAMPLVHSKVTVDAGKVEPGAGETSSALAVPSVVAVSV